MRVAIVGSGIGGLAAGAFLRQAGLDVDIYEQASQLKEVGAGLRLSPNGVRLLDRLGVRKQIRAVAVQPDVTWQLRRWDSGEVIWRRTAVARDADAPHLTIHRADLLNALWDHLPGAPPILGHKLKKASLEAGGAELQFANGETIRADVVIGADGIHSVVRDAVRPAEPPLSSGFAAYRATAPIDGTSFAGQPAAATLWLGPRKHFVAYPISRGRLMNFLGVVPARPEDEESWTADATSAEFLSDFDGWDSSIIELIEATAGVKRWALMHRAPLPTWTRGRVALLGDAAHPMLPHLAQGACQAIEDAACLASVLALDLDAPSALSIYEAVRQPRASKLQVMSQIQGQDYHLEDGPDQRARDARLAREGIPAQAWIYDYDAQEAARELAGAI